ncbi:MAG: hypothetical protein HKN94_13445 [Acidimicrobiales bacterium]|nr:hypothetical protein [Acidimicrobiales bacterium]RZV48103.1 MAG: hypothetical protein EX269_02950 [Acidimicrobiales bacterium]
MKIAVVERGRFELIGQRRLVFFVPFLALGLFVASVGVTPTLVLALIIAFFVVFGVVVHVRGRRQIQLFADRKPGPVLHASGSFGNLRGFLGTDGDYESLHMFNMDARESGAAIVLVAGTVPPTMNFIAAWHPFHFATLELPEELEVYVHVQGDKIRELHLVLGDRSLRLTARGSLQATGLQ